MELPLMQTPWGLSLHGVRNIDLAVGWRERLTRGFYYAYQCHYDVKVLNGSGGQPFIGDMQVSALHF